MQPVLISGLHLHLVFMSFFILPAGVTKVTSNLTHCGFKEQLNTASVFWIQNQGYLTLMVALEESWGGSSSGVYGYALQI